MCGCYHDWTSDSAVKKTTSTSSVWKQAGTITRVIYCSVKSWEDLKMQVTPHNISISSSFIVSHLISCCHLKPVHCTVDEADLSYICGVSIKDLKLEVASTCGGINSSHRMKIWKDLHNSKERWQQNKWTENFNTETSWVSEPVLSFLSHPTWQHENCCIDHVWFYIYMRAVKSTKHQMGMKPNFSAQEADTNQAGVALMYFID